MTFRLYIKSNLRLPRNPQIRGNCTAARLCACRSAVDEVDEGLSTVCIIDGVVHNVVFQGGCKGNTAGLSALAEGVSAEELVRKLKGIPCKGDNSCPNQLAIAIEQNLPK